MWARLRRSRTLKAVGLVLGWLVSGLLVAGGWFAFLIVFTLFGWHANPEPLEVVLSLLRYTGGLVGYWFLASRSRGAILLVAGLMTALMVFIGAVQMFTLADAPLWYRAVTFILVLIPAALLARRWPPDWRSPGRRIDTSDVDVAVMRAHASAASPTEHDYRYWAFLSYSHADIHWSRWLHRAIERYRVPRDLVGRETPYGRIPRYLFPVFRDRDELPATSDLTDAVREALVASRFLVVICSPHAAASLWVNEEVRLFKALGREDRVFCVLVHGEPNASERPEGAALEAFPPAVRYRMGPDGRLSEARAEPLAADVRPQGDGRRNAKLKVLAGILGVHLDHLRHRTARLRTLRWALAGMVALAFAALGTGMLVSQWHITEVTTVASEYKAQWLAERAAEMLREPANPTLASLLGIESLRNKPNGPAYQVWDRVFPMRPRRQFKLPAGTGLEMLGLGDDGGTLAVVTRREVQVWNTETGAMRTRFSRVAGEQLAQVLPGPAGKIVVLVTQAGVAEVRTIPEGRVMGRMAHGMGSVVLTFSFTGASLATAGADARVRVWDTVGETLRSTLEVGAPVRALAFSPDGESLAALDADGIVWLWRSDSIGKPRLLAQLQTDETVPQQGVVLRFSHNGADLAVATGGFLVRRWTAPFSGKPQRLEHSATVRAMAYGEDGALLTVTAQGDIHVWQATDGHQTLHLETVSQVEWAHFDWQAQRLATVAGRTVQIWAPRHGQELKRLISERPPTVLALDRHARRLLLGRQDKRRGLFWKEAGEATVWDLEAPSPSLTLHHDGALTALTVDPAGRLLATSAEDRTVRLWDAKTGEERVRLAMPESLNKLAFAPDGSMLAGMQTQARAYFPPAPVSVRALHHDAKPLELPHQEPVWDLAFSENGRWLATGSGFPLFAHNNNATLWDAAGQAHATLAHKDTVWSISVSAAGDRVATTTTSGQVRVWDVARKVPVLETETANVDFARVALSASGDRVMVGQGDGVVTCWEIDAGRVLWERVLELPDTAQMRTRLWEHLERTALAFGVSSDVPDVLDGAMQSANQFQVTSLALSPHGDRLAVGTLFGFTLILDAHSGDTVARLPAVPRRHASPPLNLPYSPVISVHFGAGGRRLAVASIAGVTVWDLVGTETVLLEMQPTNNLFTPQDGEWVATIGIDGIRTFGFSDRGARLVTVDTAGTVQLWRPSSGEEVAHLESPSEPHADTAPGDPSVVAALLSPDGSSLATTTGGGLVQLWNLSQERVIWSEYTGQAPEPRLAFSPDGQLLAVFNDRGNMALFDTDRGTILWSAQDIHNDMTSLTLSPDGRYLATAGSDGTVRLWDLTTKEEVIRRQYHSAITHLAFSTDGGRVLTGTADGQLQVWPWRVDDLIAEGCIRLARNLTEAEWQRFFPRQPYLPTCPGIP